MQIQTKIILELIFRSRCRQSCSLHIEGGRTADKNCFRNNSDFIADTDTEKYFLSNYFRYEFGQTVRPNLSAFLSNSLSRAQNLFTPIFCVYGGHRRIRLESGQNQVRLRSTPSGSEGVGGGGVGPAASGLWLLQKVST